MSVLAVEDCLIGKLPALFRSKDFPDMSDEDLSDLVGETKESGQERGRLEAKRGILKTGLRSLKSLHKRKSPANSPRQDQGALEESRVTPPVTLSGSGSPSVDSRYIRK